MDERKDQSQEQFDRPQSQDPSQGGYPEEGPASSVPDDAGGASADEGGRERTGSGSDDSEESGPREGSSGEGTQSTGNPESAG